MENVQFLPAQQTIAQNVSVLKDLLKRVEFPYRAGDKVGVKIHWGERGNKTFLEPAYCAAVVSELKMRGCNPYVFDTTVLYAGMRRNQLTSLETAAINGFTPETLGCPVVVADGNGERTIEIPANYKHFSTVRVANVFDDTDGFLIFSHFKGHMLAAFGGAIKNISMGFASRSQKQRMHSDAKPQLNESKCKKCGICADYCPTGAATFAPESFPHFELAKCVGCAQCIGMCPHVALKIQWATDYTVFMEKLVETAAAVWQKIGNRSFSINVALKISRECDCMSGDSERMAHDIGFFAGHNPVDVDAACLEKMTVPVLEKIYANLPWRRQFAYAYEIGFAKKLFY